MFYNYAYLDLRRPGRFAYHGMSVSFLFEPFLIGKGKGVRWSQQRSRNRYFKARMEELRACGWLPFELVVLFNKTESESVSLDLEKEAIASVGRDDMRTGPLLNMTSGGDNSFVPGRVVSERHKAILRARKGVKYPNSRRGERHPNFGKKHSQERRSVKADLFRRNNPRARSWIIVYPDGTTEKIPSLNDFCSRHGLQHSAMIGVCDGKRNHHHGFKCLRLPKICKIALDMKYAIVLR